MNDKTIIYEAAKYINKRFVECFYHFPEVVSMFTVGSMWNLETYAERRNNDYDIRLLVNQVTPDIFEAVDEYQKRISDELNHMFEGNLFVGYSNIVGPVNHHLSDFPKNLLIHLIIHTVDDLHTFLPLTHQRRYSLYHTILWGKDYLCDLQRSYTPEYLLDCHEGVRYCIDMLTRHVYKYLVWETDIDGKINFVYRETAMPTELIYESVFYSIKNIIDNLYQICVLEKDKKDITVEEYASRLCSDDKAFMKLSSAVIHRNEGVLCEFNDSIFDVTIRLLQTYEDDILNGNI